MATAQRGKTMLKGGQFGVIAFPDLVKRGSNVLQLAFQIAESALVTLVSGMRRVPLLFKDLDLSLNLSQFIRPRVRLLSGTLVPLL